MNELSTGNEKLDNSIIEAVTDGLREYHNHVLDKLSAFQENKLSNGWISSDILHESTRKLLEVLELVIEIFPKHFRLMTMMDNLVESAIRKLRGEKEIEESKVQEKQTWDNVFRKQKTCFVYLGLDIANNAYKIGRTNNLSMREMTLQCGNLHLQFVMSKQTKDPVKLERVMHSIFGPKCINKEWYALDEVDLQICEELGFNRALEEVKHEQR
jgi:hypothetical protein